MPLLQSAGGGFDKLLLGNIRMDLLQPIPGIQAIPLMFILLEMIRRSGCCRLVPGVQLQAVHLMSLLTHPSRCSSLAGATAAAGVAAATGATAAGVADTAGANAAAGAVPRPPGPWGLMLPTLGALVTSSKALWWSRWDDQMSGVILQELLLVSAQTLQLANACIIRADAQPQKKQQHKGNRADTSHADQGQRQQQGQSVQHIEAMVWAALHGVGHLWNIIRGVERVICSHAACPAYWKELAAAAAPGTEEGNLLAAFAQQQPGMAASCGSVLAGSAAAAGSVKQHHVVACTPRPASASAVGNDDGKRGRDSTALASAAVEACAPVVELTRVQDAAVVAFSVCPRSTPTAAASASSGLCSTAAARAEAAEGSSCSDSVDKGRVSLQASAGALLKVLQHYGGGLGILINHAASAPSHQPFSHQLSTIDYFSLLVGPSAAGLIMDRFSEVGVALQVVCSSCPELSSSCWSYLPKQLISGNAGQVAGVLVSRSMPFCCNNLLCGNWQGLGEAELLLQAIGKGGGVCSRCGVACYCSAQCQREAWNNHRPFCSRKGS